MAGRYRGFELGQPGGPRSSVRACPILPRELPIGREAVQNLLIAASVPPIREYARVGTLAVIALVWVGVSVVGTLFVVCFLRVGAQADEDRDALLAAERLGMERIRDEQPVVVARALDVVARRPHG